MPDTIPAAVVTLARAANGALVALVGGVVILGVTNVNIDDAESNAHLTIPLDSLRLGELADVLASINVEGQAGEVVKAEAEPTKGGEVVDFVRFRAEQAKAPKDDKS